MFRFYDNSDNYDEPVHEFLDCTVNDVMSMMYSFFLRHNLTWAALEDLAQMVNTILGNTSVPATKYLFKKMFELQKVNIHLYCTDCQKYFGKKEDLAGVDQVRCSNCFKVGTTQTKYNKNHFMTLSIEPQIVTTVKNAIKKNQFGLPRPSNDVISDVCDGQIYKDLCRQMNGRKFISLCISTDGVVVIKSSKKKSLWPIQFAINEIDPKHRYKRENIICSAFAFGDTPNMGMFFKEFIQEVNHINEIGGLEIEIGPRTERFLVVPLILTMDSVAKCHVAAITQFNGHYGCPYCHHPGNIIPPAKNVKYCFDINVRERIHEETRVAMIQASTNGQVVNGYRGISPILALSTPFDAVWIFAIDKMHSVDLGVVKKLFNIFFDSSNSRTP